MEATLVKVEPFMWNNKATSNITYNNQKESAKSTNNNQEEATLVGVVPDTENLTSMSDDSLMRAIGESKNGALEALYERYVAGCYGLALKIIGDPTLAEEIVQDVFLKVWRKPESYIAGRGKFSSWLLTLVHNRSIDKLRRTKAGVLGSSVPLDLDSGAGIALADMLPDAAPTPYDEAWREEKGSIVRSTLSLLPETQRQAISMAYFGGLTQKEIAEKLGEPLGTIKTRTRSGLIQLRQLLSRQGFAGMGDAA